MFVLLGGPAGEDGGIIQPGHEGLAVALLPVEGRAVLQNLLEELLVVFIEEGLGRLDLGVVDTVQLEELLFELFALLRLLAGRSERFWEDALAQLLELGEEHWIPIVDIHEKGGGEIARGRGDVTSCVARARLRST